MAYQIDRYNQTILTVVEDGVIDQTTDLKLIGRNYQGYGEIQNENFLFLLENFANETEPNRPVDGQLWYDSLNNRMKFYDGDQWRAVNGADVSDQRPQGLASGDFWWDTDSNQLYIYDGGGYILVGPERTGPGTTRIENIIIRDSLGDDHSALAVVIPSNANASSSGIVYITCPDEFTVDINDRVYPEFPRIKKGITLANTTDSGVSSPDSITWGTASSALGLVVNGDYVDGSQFLTQGTGEPVGITELTVSQLNIRDDVDTSLDGVSMYLNGNEFIVEYDNTGLDAFTSIRVSDSSESIPQTIFTFGPSGMMPGVTDRYDIGSTSMKVNEIHANLFEGTATSSLYSEAQNADLAEKYTSNQEYPVGTVMMVCDHFDHDVCPATSMGEAAGVVSENPAYIMNSQCKGQALGLKGRLPVRVQGPVNKGQKLYVLNHGVCSAVPNGSVVAVALEYNLSTDEQLVECILKV